MTRERPERLPYALTVASTDSGGGAGIAADLKTMTRLGVYGGCVVVSTTAQNTRGVDSTHVLPIEEVQAQFDAVVADFDLGAVKVGMLATEPAVRAVTDRLEDVDAPVIVDPVMVSTAGDVLLDPDAVEAYDALFEAATLVTPNADEAEAIVGVHPDTEDRVEEAAAAFADRGADAVLLKGGHVETNNDAVVDTLITSDGSHRFVGERVDTDRTHGSGCTLSSAIAARMARGDDLETAVKRAINFTQAAIAEPADVGENGSVNHLVDLSGVDVGEVGPVERREQRGD
jgi:hydroxymethylpyrimidine/phosphomethylpyrimidine kinase